MWLQGCGSSLDSFAPWNAGGRQPCWLAASCTIRSGAWI
nr:MAG TPA: hypothetical protein [Caudoviricetes sp.]